MRKSSLASLLTIVSAALATAAVIAIPAQQAKAMDVGQCFATDVIKQKLQEEGQQKVAIANEPVIDQDKEEIRVFTTDSTGDNGYVLSGNQPRALVSSEFCVSLRLKNVKIFDANESGVNSEALIKTENSEMARRQCENIGAGACGLHSRVLADQAQNGRKAMMQGTLMNRQKDGTYSPGNLLTLTGQMDGERRGTLGYTSPAGAYTIVTPFIDIAYAPYAISILNARRTIGNSTRN